MHLMIIMIIIIIIITIIIIIIIIIIITIIIIIIQIFKEESLSHSKVLFMRVLYLTNCSDLFKTL